uniref:Transmembrane protein 138 n=1 Tax=Cynoglossus semilaevis TaxID=244447 RepID=A0A3P8VF49_CYNSE
MLQTSNYSLVLLIQLTLLTYDLLVNSFSELTRETPVIQLVLFIIQDIAILFNVIIILLMMFNTYVFQVGLVSLLLARFRAMLFFSAVYLTLSICLHSWVLNLRWLDSNQFIWTDGLLALFVFQRIGEWHIDSPLPSNVICSVMCIITRFSLLFSPKQLQYCITTCTNGQRSIWETPDCTRTPFGCVTLLPKPVSKERTVLWSYTSIVTCFTISWSSMFLKSSDTNTVQ